MEHDSDDPPILTPLNAWWYSINHWAESLLRIFPFYPRKEVTVMRCENPKCSNKAETTRKFRDPRRGHGEEVAHIRRYCCSEECMHEIVEELERQAQYARVVQ